MILTEELKPISPQEAKDRSMFGPVYHGATSNKLEKINVQGFKISIGHERSGDVSHGYEMGGYGYGSIPAPIHHLGFGVYFTTVKVIAKQFSEGNPKIGPYFLDIPRMETINFGSPNTMMKWWLKNGYDYKITPETTFGSGKTDLHLMREERMRATLHLTETLKSKYDAVWFKGKGMRGRLLDGDQVVVFDTDRIYKVDKSLIKTGEIGSKVIAKVDIDPYGRGYIAVHAGTRGIIIDKQKPTELQTWTEGSEWIYTIRWEKGGVLYNIIDQWIDPYTNKRGLKEIDNEIKIYPLISKKEEMECVNFILNSIILKMLDAPILRKNLRKIEHRKRFQSSSGVHDLIKYKTYSKNIKPIIFAIVKLDKGTGISAYQERDGHEIMRWQLVVPTEGQLLKENTNKVEIYYPISKQEEMEVVNYILRQAITDVDLKRNFRKVAHDKKVTLGPTSAFDVINYRTYADDIPPMIFAIRKTSKGVGFSANRENKDYPIFGWRYVISTPDQLKENSEKDNITKMEEQYAVNYIFHLWANDYPDIRKTLRKISKKNNEIQYSTKINNIDYIIYVKKQDGEITVQAEQVKTGDKSLPYKFFTENKIYRRNFWKDYAKLLKENGNRFWSLEMARPFAERIKAKIVGSVLTKGKSEHDLDLRVEKWDDQIKTTLEGLGFGYYGSTVVSPKEVESSKKRYGKGWQRGHYFINDEGKIIQVWHDENHSLQEGDVEHSQALRQTGYWGRQGAGAIILAKDTGRILLPLRSNSVEQPNTWGVWGGAIDENEDPATAVRRELSEEVGYSLKIDELIPLYVYEDPRVGFRYSNFLAVIPNEFTPKLNWETQKSEWVKYGMWPKPMHFGLKLLLSRSSNEIKNEVKKYFKDLQNIKTPAIQKEKFKAAVDLINRTWGMMYRGGEIQNPRDRFDTETVNLWLLNDTFTGNLLERYGQQFYPFDNEPGYRFLNDVENVLEQLEIRYYKRISKKLDPNDSLSALKRLVQGKSWNRAKYDLAKFSLSGPIVPERAHISDEEAEHVFDRIYRVSMGETFYDVSKMESLPKLSSLTYSEGNNIVNTFIRQYVPKEKTEFPNLVKVHRGTPSPHAKIRPGDFTSFDKDYVRYYSRGKYGAVVSDILPADHLRVYKLEPGQSELIYWPEGHQIQRYTGHVPTFKEFYLQYK